MTYINWIATGSLADLLLPAQHHPLGLQDIDDADEEGMDLRFPVTEAGRQIGRLYVQARNAVRGTPGQPPEQVSW